MKVTRLVGLLFVISVALSATLVSSASAFYHFLLPIAHRGFFALSLTSILDNGQQRILCTHDLATGVILNDDEVLAKVHFLNCKVTTSAGTCPISSVNEGVTQAAELILTNNLRGLLGLLHSPPNAAGILFEPDTGKTFVTFAAVAAPCELPESAVEGDVAGLYSPTGKLQATANIVFSKATTVKNEITLILTLQGAVTVKLTLFGTAAAFESEDHVLYEQAVEVM